MAVETSTETLRMRRAMAKATAKDDVQPLDEEDQALVIKQFEQDIRDQFKLLKRVMVTLCLIWEVLILVTAWNPVHLCQFANLGSFVVHMKPFSCPPSASRLIRGIMLLGSCAHWFSLAFLLTGFKRLLQFGFYTFLLPTAVLGYCFVTGNIAEPLGASIQANAAAGLPAIADDVSKSNVDVTFIFGLLSAFIVLAVLFHYLSGNVYSSRDDLRKQLHLLSTRRYRYKSL